MILTLCCYRLLTLLALAVATTGSRTSHFLLEATLLPTEAPFRLPTDKLITAFCRPRKSTAPGPAGLTVEALRIVLDDEQTTARFLDTCQLLAQASVPPSIARATAVGRIVALEKPNGVIRGLVVGDILRRAVARAIAQHFAQDAHAACSPHQFSPSTRAGTGAVAHPLTTATSTNHQHNPLHRWRWAYDTISRQSMLQDLLHTDRVNTCLPFVRLWYVQPSEALCTYLENVYAVVPHSVPVPSMTYYLTTCTDTWPSGSTVARHGFGTKPANSPPRHHQLPTTNVNWQPWPWPPARTTGSHGRGRVQSNTSSTRPWLNTRPGCNNVHTSTTSKQRGCSLCRQPAREAITSFAFCRRKSQKLTRKNMTQRSRPAWHTSLAMAKFQQPPSPQRIYH